MSNYSNLPQDLLVEIFLRLPIKDLVNSTAVCKSWNSVIKNPNFITTHLGKTISSSDTRLVLFRLCSWEGSTIVEHYSLRFDNEDVDEYKQLHFPGNNKIRSARQCFRIVGICDGLVCLDNRDYNYILWNTFIKKAIRVPKPSVRYCYDAYDAFTGFGFDSKTNDYKLLRFVVLDDKEPNVEVEVYSLNANCWKSITSIAPKYTPRNDYPRNYGNSFVNGAIHMLACDRKVGRDLILAFDVSEEVFSEIPLPHHFSNASSLRARLLKYRESSIATMTWESDGIKGTQTDLWVMKEYGVATSWTKVWAEAEALAPTRVLFFRQEYEQVFVLKPHGWIASLDISTNHSKVFGVHSDNSLTIDDFVIVDSFVESLVLLDKCCSNARWDVISMDER
ncbi:hypothetical protein COLO4_10293 [Corchorus olitorius]|uniref:F-box domain-containing protein n=1 Tax=Corchorus olitorius TaxID=93759 RepID=A0A1R3K974_9ROSI|nr:hypothetical protein COLO4_10293 [Corchorus olitorius]